MKNIKKTTASLFLISIFINLFSLNVIADDYIYEITNTSQCVLGQIKRSEPLYTTNDPFAIELAISTRNLAKQNLSKITSTKIQLTQNLNNVSNNFQQQIDFINTNSIPKLDGDISDLDNKIHGVDGRISTIETETIPNIYTDLEHIYQSTNNLQEQINDLSETIQTNYVESTNYTHRVDEKADRIIKDVNDLEEDVVKKEDLKELKLNFLLGDTTQSISYYGTNTVEKNISISVDESNIVHKSGNEEIDGKKTFSNHLFMNEEIDKDDNSTKVPTTEWVNNSITTAISKIDFKETDMTGVLKSSDIKPLIIKFNNEEKGRYVITNTTTLNISLNNQNNNNNSSGGSIPVGTIISMPLNKCPKGYLLCDGSYYLKSDYEELSEYLGTLYYNDEYNINGDIYFNVPNFKGAYLVGAGRQDIYKNYTLRAIKNFPTLIEGEISSNDKESIYNFFTNSNNDCYYRNQQVVYTNSSASAIYQFTLDNANETFYLTSSASNQLLNTDMINGKVNELKNKLNDIGMDYEVGTKLFHTQNDDTHYLTLKIFAYHISTNKIFSLKTLPTYKDIPINPRSYTDEEDKAVIENSDAIINNAAFLKKYTEAYRFSEKISGLFNQSYEYNGKTYFLTTNDYNSLTNSINILKTNQLQELEKYRDHFKKYNIYSNIVKYYSTATGNVGNRFVVIVGLYRILSRSGEKITTSDYKSGTMIPEGLPDITAEISYSWGGGGENDDNGLYLTEGNGQPSLAPTPTLIMNKDTNIYGNSSHVTPFSHAVYYYIKY